ncbi:hypothetical protein [Paenibacillus timonensis]|uniref:hypothetical protein n=1 Tax=Paenibacillus timonensis TaxID=225915 RepID=UPI003F9AB53D
MIISIDVDATIEVMHDGIVQKIRKLLMAKSIKIVHESLLGPLFDKCGPNAGL